MLKREVCPWTKLTVRQYVVHYYPECRKEDTFRNVVLHKVKEALRRRSLNEGLSPSSFGHSKSKLICYMLMRIVLLVDLSAHLNLVYVYIYAHARETGETKHGHLFSSNWQ